MSYNVKRKSALDVIIRILLIALVAVAVIFAVKVVFFFRQDRTRSCRRRR